MSYLKNRSGLDLEGVTIGMDDQAQPIWGNHSLVKVTFGAEDGSSRTVSMDPTSYPWQPIGGGWVDTDANGNSTSVQGSGTPQIFWW
ncbi:MAG: hypothetical protein QM765_50075 [Myxococcales bacterium]